MQHLDEHLDDGTIHAWLDGELSSDEAARLERHASECAACAALVAEARGFVAGTSRIVSALDVVPGGVIPVPRAGGPAPVSRSLWGALRVTPTRAAVAASLLIAVATMLTLRHDTPNKLVPSPVPVATPLASSEMRAAPALAVKSDSARPRTKRSMQSVPSRPVAAPAVSTATLDTTRATNVVAVDARADMQSRALAPSVVGVQRRAATPMSLVRNFVGCYRVDTDSAEWLRPIPTRFALEQAGAVRAVSLDGRVDSLVVGGTWQQIAPQAVRVSFAVPNAQVLTLQLAESRGLTAHASLADQTLQVPITQTNCRP